MANEPPVSPTQDTATHHTSPAAPAAPQQPLTPVKVKPAREVTGTVRKITLPDAVYKHPNPVGRPKNRRP
jgi:hypothetical protein